MSNRTSRREFVQYVMAASVGVAAAAGPAAGQASAGAPVDGRRYIQPRKVLLWENTRKEFRELLASGDLKAIILPTGATEQHNEHLAMIQDTASATFVAQQAALRLYPQVMVATPVPVGISGHWMDHPGTLTLRPETFLAVVYDICESLKTHGVKHILILNGHAGNARPLRENVPDWQSELGIDVRFHSYWRAYTPEVTAKHMESRRVPGHAAEFETSFAMAAFPERVHWEGVDYEAAKPQLRISDPRMAQDDEQFAQQAKLATTAKGEAMITIAVDWVVARMQEMIATT